MAIVLGYLITYDQAAPFFACLNKRGPTYWKLHEAQYRHFIDDRPTGDIAMVFGDKSSQYIRPKPHSTINVLGLCNVNQDLF